MISCGNTQGFLIFETWHSLSLTRSLALSNTAVYPSVSVKNGTVEYRSSPLIDIPARTSVCGFERGEPNQAEKFRARLQI